MTSARIRPIRRTLAASAVAALAMSALAPAGAQAFHHDYRVNIDVGADGIPAQNFWAAGDSPQSLHKEMKGLDATSWATGQSLADHGGTVRAAASLDDIGGLNQSLWVMSDLTYTFELQARADVPPAATVPVSVAARAMHTIPRSFNDGEAKFTLQQTGQRNYLIYEQAYTMRRSPAFDLFAVNRIVDLIPGTLYTVYQYAQTHAYNTTVTDGTVTVTADEVVVDPVFTIDPAYAADYTLVGIPTSPVPEPASAALMALGATALAVKRRRRSAGLPPATPRKAMGSRWV
ncbi:MAG: PEP-CTERM sorting domain-containing protein [Rubrivivax sp.]